MSAAPTKPAAEPYVASVRPIPGEPTRFYVRSKSHPDREPYLVDVAAHNGAGQCACIRWDTVCWPLIRDTKNLAPSKRCRHLKAARELACTLTIRQYLKEHPSE
jgi:hypothetical protein